MWKLPPNAIEAELGKDEPDHDHIAPLSARTRGWLDVFEEMLTRMDLKLELVAIPVSDVDRAKAFYTDQAGLNADHDHTVSDEIRFVQLTPAASACSIALGLQLAVSDTGAARAELDRD